LLQVSTKLTKKQRSGSHQSKGTMASIELLKTPNLTLKVPVTTKQSSLLNFFSPIAKQGLSAFSVKK